MAKDYTIAVTINGHDKGSGVMQKFGETAAKWLKRAEVAAIAAAVAFAAFSMKAGVDYERQMSNVEAVTRASADEMAALSEKAKQLGRDSAFSATQSGQAMEYLAMAGFNTTQILSSVGDTLNLAAAGSLELAEAADIASNVLTGFSLPATMMGRVADTMAETAARSNTNIRQLGEAMSYVAPQAAAAGWSLELTSAAIGMLGNAGIQGSMAGTVLRQAIMQLLDPTEEAQKAMWALGMSVVDSNGQLMSLDKILAQIDPAVLDTAEGLKYLTQIFGVRSTSGIVALVKQGADNLAGFTEQLENAGGAAEEMAKTKLNNLWGALTLMKSSLEAVSLALVTGGENSVTGSLKTYITEGVIPALNATAKWIESVGGLPGMLAIAADVLRMFGNDLKTMFSRLADWDIFSEFVWQLLVALTKMTLAFGKWLVEIGLALIIAAKDIFVPLLAPFNVALSWLKNKFDQFINWIGPKAVTAANAMLKPFRWVFEKMGIEIGELDWTPITETPVLTMKEEWGRGWGLVKQDVIDAAGRIKDATMDLGGTFVEYGRDIKNVIGELNPEFMNYGEKIEDIVRKHQNWNHEIKATGDAASAVDTVTTAAHGLTLGMFAARNAANAFGYELLHKTVLIGKELGIGSKLWNATTELGRHTRDSLNLGWQTYLDNIPAYATQVAGAANHMGLTIEREMSKSFETFMRTGRLTFSGGWKAIQQQARQTLADMFATTLMDTVVKGGVAYMVDLVTGDKDGNSGFAKIKADAVKLWTAVKDGAVGAAGLAGGSWETAGTIASGAWEAIKWIGDFSVSVAAALAGAAWAAAAAVANGAWMLLKWVASFNVTNAAVIAGSAWGAAGAVANGAWMLLKWIGSFNVSNAAVSAGSSWGAAGAVAAGAWAAIKWIGSFSVSVAAAAAGAVWAAAAATATAAWGLFKGAVSGISSVFTSGAVPAAVSGFIGSFGGVSTILGGGLLAGLAVVGGGWLSSWFNNLMSGTYNEWMRRYAEMDRARGSMPTPNDQITRSGAAGTTVTITPAEIIPERTQGSAADAATSMSRSGRSYHSGGMIPNEGLFLGLSGEGVLNRRAMSSIGESGLQQLNSGRMPGNTNTFYIYAIDSEHLEQTVRRKIIPILMERSEAGEEIISDRGIKQAG